MATQIFCDRCGKKMTQEEKDHAAMQVRYRKAYSALAWESKWNDLCYTCYDEFEKWFFKEKGDDG